MNLQWVNNLFNALLLSATKNRFVLCLYWQDEFKEMDSQMNNWHQSLYSWKNQQNGTTVVVAGALSHSYNYLQLYSVSVASFYILLTDC